MWNDPIIVSCIDYSVSYQFTEYKIRIWNYQSNRSVRGSSRAVHSATRHHTGHMNRIAAVVRRNVAPDPSVASPVARRRCDSHTRALRLSHTTVSLWGPFEQTVKIDAPASLHLQRRLRYFSHMHTLQPHAAHPIAACIGPMPIQRANQPRARQVRAP